MIEELNKNLAKAYVDKGQFETAVSIYKKLIEDANYYEVESLNKDFKLSPLNSVLAK